MHKIAFLTLCTVMIFCAGCASTRGDRVPSSEPAPVVLDNTQVFTQYSPTLDHTFRLRVALPASYSSKETATYPLIVKLDGQWDFPLAVGAYNCITFDGQMPEAVIVGIDWGDVEGNIHEIRARDLMPEPTSWFPDGGHARAFINALATEIIPQLEERFRLNDERVLIGGSMSAIFATYALLEAPESFTGAIAIAGDYTATPDVFQQRIKALAGTDALSGKRLYLGVGDLDSVAQSNQDLAATLAKTDLPGFELRFDRLPGFGHSGMNLPGYAAGYQHVFKRPDKAISLAELQAVSGEYTGEGKQSPELIFLIENNGLSAQKADGTRIPLKAKSATEFYHPGMRFDVRFAGDRVSVAYPFSSYEYKRSE